MVNNKEKHIQLAIKSIFSDATASVQDRSNFWEDEPYACLEIPWTLTYLTTFIYLP